MVTFCLRFPLVTYFPAFAPRSLALATGYVFFALFHAPVTCILLSVLIGWSCYEGVNARGEKKRKLFPFFSPRVSLTRVSPPTLCFSSASYAGHRNIRKRERLVIYSFLYLWNNLFLQLSRLLIGQRTWILVDSGLGTIVIAVLILHFIEEVISWQNGHENGHATARLPNKLLDGRAGRHEDTNSHWCRHGGFLSWTNTGKIALIFERRNHRTTSTNVEIIEWTETNVYNSFPKF